MVIQVVSDVHNETQADWGAEFCRSMDGKGVDALVIAGDFCSWRTNDHSRFLFDQLAPKYPRILYVPGNHEYWGVGSHREMPPRLRKLERDYPNVTVLDNRLVEIDGQRFLGGTMWYCEPGPELAAVKLRWPDYKRIKDAEPWIYEQNRAFRVMAETHLRAGDVVITHHQPSRRSIHPKYAGDPSNHFYVTEMDALILERKPRLWIHGHTHTPFDYQLGDTRVLCNPHGYPHEVQTLAAFDVKKVLSL